jgi:hypothetical protein
MALYQTLADPLLHQYGVEECRAARAVVLDALEAGLAWNPPESNPLMQTRTDPFGSSSDEE